jgi:hypothetical protein
MSKKELLKRLWRILKPVVITIGIILFLYEAVTLVGSGTGWRVIK